MSRAAEFLPQFAAQATADLEEMIESVDTGLKRNPANARAFLSQADNLAIYEEAKFLAGVIRSSVHIVLPKNGEIYRANFPLPTPTGDEIESLNGLPAPTTCFEFLCDSVVPPAKMLAIVIDRKQLEEGQTGLVVLLTRDNDGRFPPTRNAVFFPCPLEFVPQSDKQFTALMCRAFRVSKNREPIPGDREAPIVELVSRGLHAAIQCCHSLRAGATLEERTEPSAGRRWKMEKKGVGGFTYHVLRLPDHVGGGSATATGGSHASPRFHVRRAHIRKLPTGVLTFVRQCFVGDRERGLVDKHYEVAAGRPSAG